ncbi:DUF4097 family beta strand repeat-containing protein [Pseudoalteromonas gelatinilytica]
MTIASFKRAICATAISSSLLLTGCVIHVSQGQIAEQKQQDLSVSAANINELKIDAEAGSLIIKGDSNTTAITVNANIYAAKGDETYTLTLEKHGDTAELISKLNNGSLSFYSGSSPYIDLIVSVPSNLKLDIDDDSGDIVIRAMQNDISIDDDSGSIVIEGGRTINIDDDSGDIRISKVSGNISIEDDSGSIMIDQGQGRIDIEDDSGDIRIENSQGPARIIDESGSISVNTLAGALTIEDGSGDIDVRQIKGLVTITDGSGSIYVDDTLGLTIIEAGSGDLSIDNINGPVKLDK